MKKEKIKEEKKEKRKSSSKRIGRIISTTLVLCLFIAALVFTSHTVRNIYYINSIVKAENALTESNNYKISKHSSSSLVDLKIEFYALNGKYKQHSIFDVNQELFPDAIDEEFIGFTKDGKGYTVSLSGKEYREGDLEGTTVNEYMYSHFYHISLLDILKYKISKEDYEGTPCIKVENNLSEGVKSEYYKLDTRLLYVQVFEDGAVNSQNVEFGVVTDEDVKEISLDGYKKVEETEEAKENQRLLDLPIEFSKNDSNSLEKIYENDDYRVFVYSGDLKCKLGEYTGRIQEMLDTKIIIADDLVRQINTDCANGKCSTKKFDEVDGLEFYYDNYAVFYVENKGKNNLFYFDIGKSYSVLKNEIMAAE